MKKKLFLLLPLTIALLLYISFVFAPSFAVAGPKGEVSTTGPCGTFYAGTKGVLLAEWTGAFIVYASAITVVYLLILKFT